ncbi:hypothetical protein PA08_0940 [Cutibacterium modestum P08]|nr:hypothetical protein PA08_0940 [Cutibacterium modestum P08]
MGDVPMAHDAETFRLPNDHDVVGEVKTPRQSALVRRKNE